VAVAPYLWHLGIKNLDIVAATHNDADHVQGFLDIIPAFGIQRAFAVPPVAAWDVPFSDRLRPGRLRVENLKRGHQLEIEGVSVDVPGAI
jgi:beta-lactamase superfamily II metal-dependent hydrolase